MAFQGFRAHHAEPELSKCRSPQRLDRVRRGVGSGGEAYLGAAILIIVVNIAEVPSAIALIFTHAFTPAAATGGFAGAAVAAAIRFGVARGVFSNESGLGSAAIAHAAAQTNSPVRQGIIAMLGTFIDTLVVCTMTALVILTSGAWTMTGLPVTVRFPRGPGRRVNVRMT